MEIVIAGPEHIHYAKTISLTIEESAKDRGTGIARRTPEYIIQKMQNGNAAFNANPIEIQLVTLTFPAFLWLRY